jgi:hypothetical protein
MNHDRERTHLSVVHATVQQVLPSFGVAYLSDDQDNEWAVTRTTPGETESLGCLEPGQRLKLTVEHFPEYSLVSQWGSLD